MDNDILDFLPIYPDINEPSFNNDIYIKNEFFKHKLEAFEDLPKKKGDLLQHQQIISKFFSSNTLYDNLLLYHSMGTGKTFTSIACIEQIREEKSPFKKALILTKGPLLKTRFQKELIEAWKGGKYKSKRKMKDKNRINTSLINDFYEFKNFQEFANEVSNMSDSKIIDEYSNYIVVIDEVHNIRLGKVEEKKMYNQFHRFLHLINNSKILLMSGTPIKDKIIEIADVMNLILPLDQQFPVKKHFIKKYFDIIEEFDNDKVYRLKNNPDIIADIKSKFQGRISYLKNVQSNVIKNFVGVKQYSNLTNFTVYPLMMSDFQTQHYIEAYNKDLNEDGAKSEDFLDKNSSLASIFVFPDGKPDSYSKYIREPNIAIKKELLQEIFDKDEDTMLEKIGKFSAKYEHLIRNILKAVRDPVNKRCVFVYNSSVRNGGLVLLTQLLKLFNFKQATGMETTKGLRYIFINLQNKKQSEIAIERFKKEDNVHGEYISVILGSKLVAEGFSFHHIQEEYIITPHWNYSEIDQAVARGLRFGSHKVLEKDFERTYLQSLSEDELSNILASLNNKIVTKKNDIINAILQDPDYVYVSPVKPKVDIYLYVAVPNVDFVSVDVKHYRKSEVKDINSKMIERVIKESAFDCALNYNRNKILGYDNERECDYQSCEYKCDNVVNLIPRQIDISTDQLFYIDDDANKNLKQKVKEIFKTKYSLIVDDIVQISKQLKINQRYIFLFLKQIIDNKEVVYNKIGIPCFLYENHNIFYIVDSANIGNNYLSSYYTKNPNIHTHVTYEKLSLDDKSSAHIVQQLFQENNYETIKNILISAKPEILQVILEEIILARQQNINVNQKQRDLIYTFFEPYVKQFGDILLSWLPLGIKKENYNDMRYLDLQTNEWKDVDKSTTKMFLDYLDVEFKQNKYGYYGYYAYDNKIEKFLIVNETNPVKLKKNKIVKKPKTKSKKQPTEEEAIEDKRTSYQGKYCNNFNKLELYDLISNVFGINPNEKDYRWVEVDTMDADEIADQIKKYKQISSYLTKNKLNKNQIKMLIYWYGIDKEEMCEIVRKFLDENRLTINFFTV